MSPFKSVFSLITLLLVISYFIVPNPKIEPVDPAQLPWHVVIDTENNASIFGLTFDVDTFDKAIQVFGEPEKIALYADDNKPNIEAYFGNITKAGLTAKVIISLALTPQQTDEFLQRANSRMLSNSHIPKIDISANDRVKTRSMKITSLAYIPQYSGLPKDYLIDRFGIPDYELKLSETATQLFYKPLGLSVIADTEGKEIFQYTHPSNLKIPMQAVVYGI